MKAHRGTLHKISTAGMEDSLKEIIEFLDKFYIEYQISYWSYVSSWSRDGLPKGESPRRVIEIRSEYSGSSWWGLPPDRWIVYGEGRILVVDENELDIIFNERREQLMEEISEVVQGITEAQQLECLSYLKKIRRK